MDILGVLIGITMCITAASIWVAHKQWKDIIFRSQIDDARISLLERRKSPSEVLVPGKPVEQVKVNGPRPISWSQARDAAEAGENN